MTFEGAASALGGSPKASGLLLAFSCPHTRPAWAWPEGSPTSAWPRKAAESGAVCLSGHIHRLHSPADTHKPFWTSTLCHDTPRQGPLPCPEPLNSAHTINLKEPCALQGTRRVPLPAPAAPTALRGSRPQRVGTRVVSGASLGRSWGSVCSGGEAVASQGRERGQAPCTHTRV